MKQAMLGITLCILVTAAEDVRGAQYSIGGRVIDSITEKPLAGANVMIEGTARGLPAGEGGHFHFAAVEQGVYTMSVSYVGYTVQKIRVSVFSNIENITFAMEQTILPGEKIYVTATRARERHSPAAVSNISSGELNDRYTMQDIPVLLSELPSTSFYSESGNGIGYNYLTLRGFDQRRISVMINGIPQNDPEDHDVYWVDFPDLAANLQDIQLQRGAGSSFYGPPAIGGSVNLVTSMFSPLPETRIGVGFGSFNTQKYTLELNSGLIGNTYGFYARFSRLLSEGYRDDSWVDYYSYFFGAARYTEHTTTNIHLYGGPIQDHLAYYGIPKSYLKDRELRKRNPLSADPEVTNQIENFFQPHYELLHTWKLDDTYTLHNSFFYVQGDGFFDYDGSWADTTYYRITREFGFAPDTNPDKSLIRAGVANKQGGWLPRLSMKHTRGEFNIGLEARYHQSLHWGRVLWAQHLPSGVPSDRRFYEYKGAKTMASLYVDEAFRVTEKALIKASVQMVHNAYRVFDETFIGSDFRVSYLFINPRIGININFTDKTNAYFNYSRTEREPRLKNLYDAAESGGGAAPQFREDAPGIYDFDDPLVRHEVLNDFELGYHIAMNDYHASVNLFYMGFQDEIVKSGGLDRFGIPRTGNAERTSHRGLEIAAEGAPLPGLKVSANASFSRNELDRYTFYGSANEYIQNPSNPDSTVAYILDGNKLAGFAGVLWNVRASYEIERFKVSLWAHHEGRKYTDNFEGAWYLTGEPRPETVVDPATVLNGSLSYHIDSMWNLRNLDFILQVFNITNGLYATHGEGDEFYPAATRNVYAGLEIGM